MKTHIALLFMILVAATAQAEGVLSFKDWKTRRVAEKTSLVNQIKRDKSIDAETKKPRIELAVQNLEIESDLTAEDYFQMYIMERFQGHPEKVKEAVMKMSKEDLATIIQSYSDLLNQVRGMNVNSNPQQTAL